MIARIWHGWTSPGNADAYQQLLQTKILPGIHRVAGYKGAHLLRRARTALCAPVQTNSLPRKTGDNAPCEQVPGDDVIYDSVKTRAGYRVRRITTIPQNAIGKLPAVFMVGWLSCDSVEQPGMRSDGFAELM